MKKLQPSFYPLFYILCILLSLTFATERPPNHVTQFPNQDLPRVKVTSLKRREQGLTGERNVVVIAYEAQAKVQAAAPTHNCTVHTVSPLASMSVTAYTQCSDVLSVKLAKSDLWVFEIRTAEPCPADLNYRQPIGQPLILLQVTSQSELSTKCLPVLKLPSNEQSYFPTVIVLLTVIVIHVTIMISILVWVCKRSQHTYKPFISHSQAASTNIESRATSLSSPSVLLTPSSQRHYGSFFEAKKSMSPRRLSADLNMNSWISNQENNSYANRRKRAQAIVTSSVLPEEKPQAEQIGVIDCSSSDLHVRRQKNKPQIIVSMIEETV